jgi:hypothetical protein
MASSQLPASCMTAAPSPAGNHETHTQTCPCSCVFGRHRSAPPPPPQFTGRPADDVLTREEIIVVARPIEEDQKAMAPSCHITSTVVQVPATDMGRSHSLLCKSNRRRSFQCWLLVNRPPWARADGDSSSTTTSSVGRAACWRRAAKETTAIQCTSTRASALEKVPLIAFNPSGHLGD